MWTARKKVCGLFGMSEHIRWIGLLHILALVIERRNFSPKATVSVASAPFFLIILRYGTAQLAYYERQASKLLQARVLYFIFELRSIYQNICRIDITNGRAVMEKSLARPGPVHAVNSSMQPTHHCNHLQKSVYHAVSWGLFSVIAFLGIQWVLRTGFSLSKYSGTVP